MLTLHATSKYILCIVWLTPALTNSDLTFVSTVPVSENFIFIPGPIPDNILIPVILPKSYFSHTFFTVYQSILYFYGYI